MKLKKMTRDEAISFIREEGFEVPPTAFKQSSISKFFGENVDESFVYATKEYGYIAANNVKAP